VSSPFINDIEAKLLEAFTRSRAERAGVGWFGSHLEAVGIHLNVLRPAILHIGFIDSSNPFYLFSKMNAGLLLLAPFAECIRKEYPLLIALRGG
jgi:hypothetical protein